MMKAAVPVMSAISKPRVIFRLTTYSEKWLIWIKSISGFAVWGARSYCTKDSSVPHSYIKWACFACHISLHQLTPCKWKPSITGTEQLCAETARSGCMLYPNMATEGKLLRDHSNLWTCSDDRLLFVLHYHLFTLFSLFCWQSPAEVTVSQPTLTANGTNG